ncbi:MAG: hypothetical protein RIC57_09235 [Balneola sp.]
MYRLARVIEVSWNEFKKLELWEIKNLAIVTGELVVADKINELDVLLAYEHITHSEKPGEQRGNYEREFKKPVTIEAELSPEEFEEFAIHHNNRAIEDLINANR